MGCNITLGVKNNELRRITPRENMDVNDAWICDKGRFAHGFVGHPDRLQTPLIRREGELRPGTWDEALDLIAQRLGDVVKTSGPQAVGGLGSTHITNEANYLFQRFMRSVIGTNNVDHLDRMPSRATPLTSLPELEHKDVIVLLGLDPSTETPLVELWIKKAVLRHGARVLVVNPRQIELARYGGPWLGYRPGSEAALLNGLARAILEANGESQAAATIETRVTNLDEFRGWLRDYGPRQVEQLTGASAGSLQQAARILAQAKHPIILYGPNWLRGAPQGTGTLGSSPAEHTLDAMENLATLLGGIEVGFVAGDSNTLGALKMGLVPGLYPGRQSFKDTKIRSRLAGMWSGRLSPIEGLDFEGMTRAGREGNLEAMWIIGADPANSSQRSRRGPGQNTLPGRPGSIHDRHSIHGRGCTASRQLCRNRRQLYQRHGADSGHARRGPPARRGSTRLVDHHRKSQREWWIASASEPGISPGRRRYWRKSPRCCLAIAVSTWPA